MGALGVRSMPLLARFSTDTTQRAATACAEVNWRNASHAYTERDSMIYAMAVGMGRDPFDACGRQAETVLILPE